MAFGPKTDGKIREFQGKSSLTHDGVVGPMIRDKREPMLDALVGMIQMPADEQNDLPAWCGIFCYYVYRTAGINLGGRTSHHDNLSARSTATSARGSRA